MRSLRGASSYRFDSGSESPLSWNPQVNHVTKGEVSKCQRSYRRIGLIGLGVVAVLLAPSHVQPTQAQIPGNIAYERGGLTFVTGAGSIDGRGVVFVGNNGVGDFDGASWKLTNKLGPDDLVDHGWTSMATRGTQAWAVNELCAAMRISPTSEEYIDIGLQCRLFDVAIGNDGTIWAGGELSEDQANTTSLLLTHDPQSSEWGARKSPPGQKVWAVHLDDKGIPWVSVRLATGSYGVFRWDDDMSHWESMLLTDCPVMDFAHDPSGALWVVGGRMGVFAKPSLQLVAVYRDGRFQIVMNGEGPILRDVLFDSTGTGWAAGELGSILKRDAGSDHWSLVFDTFIGTYGMNVIVESKDALWFLGDIQFVRYQGGAFTYWGGEHRPWNADGITSISVPNFGSAWATGWWGPVLHRESGIWVERYDVPHTLNSRLVMATSDQDVWVAYDRPGIVSHFDGLAWEEVTVPSEFPVIDLVSAGSDGLWVLTSAYFSQQTVAKGARILRFLNHQWTVAYENPDIRLVDMAIHGGSEIWVVGDRFLTLENGRFSEQLVPGAALDEVLVACAVVNAGSGWLASRTSVYRVRGEEVVRIPVITGRDGAVLNKVVADSENEAWVVGYAGLHHVTVDGATFIDIEAARSSQIQLNDVALLRDNGRAIVWAVGRLETIVRYSEVPSADGSATPTPSALPSATTRLPARSHLYLPLLTGGHILERAGRHHPNLQYATNP